jgi:hypothetical protein
MVVVKGIRVAIYLPREALSARGGYRRAQAQVVVDRKSMRTRSQSPTSALCGTTHSPSTVDIDTMLVLVDSTCTICCASRACA